MVILSNFYGDNNNIIRSITLPVTCIIIIIRLNNVNFYVLKLEAFRLFRVPTWTNIFAVETRCCSPSRRNTIFVNFSFWYCRGSITTKKHWYVECFSLVVTSELKRYFFITWIFSSNFYSYTHDFLRSVDLLQNLFHYSSRNESQ